jgi:hypothetical protein
LVLVYCNSINVDLRSFKAMFFVLFTILNFLLDIESGIEMLSVEGTAELSKELVEAVNFFLISFFSFLDFFGFLLLSCFFSSFFFSYFLGSGLFFEFLFVFKS